MSKKRVNFGSVAVSEAARRELMKPVTCWEQTWVVPEGSKVRVRQWVQTNKQPVRRSAISCTYLISYITCRSGVTMKQML
jgi:hypothetical protein